VILHRLVSQVDVVLANYRPDVAAKLGVDYESLARLNPRIIYCEVTAYGREGPDAHRPGYDMIIQAQSGLMASETKSENGVPQQIWSTPLIDTNCGINLMGCVCAALYARERTGRGQKIETNLLASALTLMGPRFLHVESQDRANRSKTLADIAAKRAASASYMETLAASPGSRRQTHHATMYYRVYLSKDVPIAVGCLNEVQRRRLLELLELEDMHLESGFDPTSAEAVAYARDLTNQAEVIFARQVSAEWLRVLEDRGIPAGLVKFAEELFEDPQIHASGLLTEFEHRDAGTVKMMGPLARFSETALPESGSSPALGQHSAEILAELGFSEDEYRKWKQEGIVG
jgi:formyl-CoA transferase